MENNLDKIYQLKHVARFTDLAKSTIGKYGRLLEASGKYEFLKDKNGNRGYTDENIKHFIEIKARSTNEPLETIIADIVARNTKGVATVTRDIEYSEESYNNAIQTIMELKNVVDRQSEIISELTERIDQMDDKQRETLMIQRENAKMLKELAIGLEEKKKGFFSRLFS